MKGASRRPNKNKYITAALGAAALCLSAAYATERSSVHESVHAAITRSALAQTLSPASLKLIVDANDSQDAQGSEGAREKRRHFEGCAMPAAVAYINREKNRTLNYAAAADTDEESRAAALRHFGLMAHSIQDFYLHTNYLELMLEDEKNRRDPYNIALVDWNKVPDGYAGIKSGTPLRGFDSSSNDDKLNKTSGTAAGGKLLIGGGINQFEAASDLASRETQRQWNLFETLVRGRCGARAAAVLSALKQGAQPSARQASTPSSN